MSLRKEISVIIPARNEAACIRRTLSAVLDSAAFFQGAGQGGLHLGNSPVEMLVVDNQSTDGTGRIVQEYARSCGVRWMSCRQLGAACARNCGQRHSSGRLLVFLDAVTIIYMLHYVRDPVALLKEARRVCRSALIVIQTVCEGSAGPRFHQLNEFISRVDFPAARRLGAIRPVSCPLHSAYGFSRATFLQIAQKAGPAPGWLRAEWQYRLLPLFRITCTLEPPEVLKQ